jgi:hypothetical protein
MLSFMQNWPIDKIASRYQISKPLLTEQQIKVDFIHTVTVKGILSYVRLLIRR